jgi:hypothetical protein
VEHARVRLAQEAGTYQLRMSIFNTRPGDTTAWKPHPREAGDGWWDHSSAKQPATPRPRVVTSSSVHKAEALFNQAVALLLLLLLLFFGVIHIRDW